VEHGPAG